MTAPTPSNIAAAEPFSADEIRAIRAATPGCTDALVHLNHAGSSLPPHVVLDAQIDHLRREAAMGGYEAAAMMADAEGAVYDSIAAMIRADRSEIARFPSAAEAWLAAFWSIPMERGQRIIVHDHEYGANAVSFIHAAKTRGIVIDRVPNDASGQVSIEAIAERLDGADDVAMVSLTWVPTNSGLVNPAEAVGELTRAAGAIFLVDACQAVGQLDVDVEAVQCDFLSATGRKYLRGPRGTGFLYARTSVLDRVVPSQPDHHAADWSATDDYTFSDGATRFEVWEFSHANWLGLGAAVDHAMGWGLERIEVTIARRAAQLRSMLADLDVTVYDIGERLCGMVTFASDRVRAGEIQARLRAIGVNVSSTMIGSSRYDVEARNLPELVRMSVHCTTTDDELVRAVDALRSLL